MNDNFNRFNRFALTLLWLFSFSVIIFMITLTAHAESYFPMGQNDNNTIPDFVIEYCETNFDSENNNIIIQGPEIVGSYTIFHVVYWSKSDDFNCYGEINSNCYQWSLYKIGSFTTNYKEVKYQSNKPYSSSIRVNVENSNFYWLNRLSSLYNTSISYVSNFRIYTTNTADAGVVLKYGSDNPIVDIGTAIIPAPFFEPSYVSGDTPPTNVPPSYTINNYSWTTNNPPSFDSSSVEAGLESLGDIITYQIAWLSDNLHGEFSTLTSNIKGLFDYIGKTLQYYGNAIISTINNAIQNFYDNMSALVQPIFEKIAYITEDVDYDEVSTAFNSTSFVGLKNQFNTFFTTFENAFDISEPNTFTLTINIQNIDTFYNFGCRSPVIIHLDYHFNPIKAALRTFLWILISFGSVFVVERGLSNWLRGENDTK